MGYGTIPSLNEGDLVPLSSINQWGLNEAYLYAQIRYVGIEVVVPTGGCATGDGKKYFMIPADLTGMNLVSCHAYHVTAGAGGSATLIQVHNETDNQDFLSVRLMVDVGEKPSDTAGTAYVIDAAHDDVATFDIVRIDVDQLPTTVPLGLVVTLGFQHP